MLLGIALDVVGAGLDDRLEHVVGTGCFGRINDLADAVEQEADAVGFAERTAGLGKGGADFAGGTVAVVGQRLDDDRGPTRPVTFVTHLVIGRIGLAAGAAPNRAVDRVLRHIGLAGGQHRRAQPRVRSRIGQPGAGRSRQFPDDLGKDLAALFVLRALPVHDVFELRVASHRSPRGSPSASGAKLFIGLWTGLTTQYGRIGASGAAADRIANRPNFRPVGVSGAAPAARGGRRFAPAQPAVRARYRRRFQAESRTTCLRRRRPAG